MKKATIALLLLALVSPVLAAPKKAPSEFFGAVAFDDSRNSADRTIVAEGSFVFPLFQHFSLGPAVRYNYVRNETETTSTTTYTLPSLSWPPPTAVTTTTTDTSAEDIWSLGARAVLYGKPSHVGLYAGAQAMFPQADGSQGWLAIPFAGFQWAWGRAIGHVEYQRPYQYSEGAGAADLEHDVFVFGVGAKF